MSRIALPLVLTLLIGCTPGEAADEEAAVPPEGGAATSSLRPEGTGEWPPAGDSIPGTPWTRQDWEIFTRTLAEAERLRLDTLPLGEAIGEMGALFLGTPYVPRTLEVPGAERLVVNLRGLDCVTFVENVLALTRFHRVHGAELAVRDAAAARARYEADLAALRYRSGQPEGYASRLHYFSEWMQRADANGRIRLVTAELGGVPDPEPLGFMTAHPEAYPQLADPAELAGIVDAEAAVNAAGPRVYLPEDRIQGAADGIRTGDVIAATSTVEGLDVAHTGIAYWRDGALHLMHAPLVGSTVVLSERTLAERIRGIASQDGILVGRPLEDWFTPGTTGGSRP